MSSGQPIAVLGYGVTGQSVVRHLRRTGIEPVVLDTRPVGPAIDPDVEIVWDCQQWPDINVATAVVSPGLALDSCLVASAQRAGVELISDIDLFFDAVTAPVVGITGTNGKSTVTSLAGHLIQSAGLSCGVGGNLGEAALDIVDPNHDSYVLELSSFQLERSKLHRFHAATILNISEDHLDKHGDMAHYVASKQRIYAKANQCLYNRADALTQPKGSDAAVSFGPDAPTRVQDWGVQTFAGDRFFMHGEQQICATTATTLQGTHNEQNMLAACALVEPWLSGPELSAGLKSFSGLAHRFETVAFIDAITYVNDSKATNLGATMAALAGMPAANQVVLIAGGDAKGVDLTPLASVLTDRVKHIVTLGQDGPALAAIAVAQKIPTTACVDMSAAVRSAISVAGAGDTVLLSPACASLDMFSSYAQRGEQFADAVLKAVGGSAR